MIDTSTDTWVIVRQLCEAGIVNAAQTLEVTQLPMETTEYQRGIIAAFRMVMALAAPAQQPEITVTHDY